jgi:hypothetical protein
MATTRARRSAAAACLVVVAVATAGCDVRIGPPPQDVGEEPNAAYAGQVSR